MPDPDTATATAFDPADPPVWDDAFRRDFAALLTWRRDVRRFRTDPIPEDTVTRLLGLAHLAPSVGFSQPWRFVRVRDPGRRRAVLEDHLAAKAEAGAVYDAETAPRYQALKLAGLDDAPVHLAVCCDTATTDGRGLGQQTMPETAPYSVVCAIHTLWLAARLEGIGLGWISIVHPARLHAVLDLPEAWTLVAYLCLGYPEAARPTPELIAAGWQARLPLEAVLAER
ncbi:5,6-dimethylbenzimidazole synthase [Roseospira goensis]|uniref:5,6-dimethylbenzimidazole synthase n=1 Tax=Roseospira goensis TaxID=391922 RepID=A0A7W6WLI8_9PROT|nr:5,6-dimethylbenzimidazole synthase [Roseospira goensis]MBB4286889.1 5,6-dimethylbenzimidazole synthase [Roseospira goensis]